MNQMATNESTHAFIGAYSEGQRQAILCEFNTKQMVVKKINIQLANPSYIYSRNKYIYVVQQTNNGHLTIIKKIEDNKYQLIKSQQTYGNDPCHITINNIGNRLVVTNYSSGSFIMYQIVDNVTCQIYAFVTHQGKSINQERQLSPHPHCSVFSNDDKVLFVSDLGTDTVYWYSVSYEGSQSLQCQKEKCLKIAGCGPRHLAKGQKNQKILYLTGELDSSIRLLSYQRGKLELVSAYRVSNNPQNYPSQVLYKDGKVYMSNRGDDYIIVFESDGWKLQQKYKFKVGKYPRHFTISKDNKYMYIACQKQNVVQIYKFENQKIYLSESFVIHQPSCVCIEE